MTGGKQCLDREATVSLIVRTRFLQDEAGHAGEKVHEDLHLTEEQWTVDGFYGKENQFSSRVWTMAYS